VARPSVFNRVFYSKSTGLKNQNKTQTPKQLQFKTSCKEWYVAETKWRYTESYANSQRFLSSRMSAIKIIEP